MNAKLFAGINADTRQCRAHYRYSVLSQTLPVRATVHEG
jgi:hypothetical protein